MRTLRTRLILSHVLPILIVVPLIGLAAFVLLRLQGSLATVQEQAQQQAAALQEQAQLLSQAAGRLDALLDDPAQAGAFLESIELDVTGVTLLDAEGRVLAARGDAPPAPAALEGEGARPDISTLLGEQGSVKLTMSGEAGRRLAEFAIPVLGDDAQLRGVLLLSQQVADVQAQFANLSRLLAATIALLFALGIGVGVLLALRLSRSLREVTDALQGIARGERPATLPEHETLEVDRLYNSVNTLAERLHTLEDARRRLLANLVHELARPLGSMNAAVHALRTGADADPALRRELVEGIGAQVDRMQPLLEDLTQLHGQLLGPLELNRTRTALTPWLTQLLSLWREAARQKGIAWQADVPLALPEVAFDADQMARALGNLLSNAVKFTPVGGTIEVQARVQVDDADPVRSVQIMVSDSGPGIPLADQRRIFEPFVRGTGDRRFPQGVGLGLTIAREIVQAHGGTLALESTPNRGSRFTLSFPA